MCYLQFLFVSIPWGPFYPTNVLRWEFFFLLFIIIFVSLSLGGSVGGTGGYCHKRLQ